MMQYNRFITLILVSFVLCYVTHISPAAALDKAWKRYRHAVVRISVTGTTVDNDTKTFFGTGVILSPTGYIITTMHTLRDDDYWQPDESGNLRVIEVEVLGEDELMPPVPARLIDSDPDHDASLLLIDGSDYKPARCTLTSAAVTDTLTLIGYPKPENGMSVPAADVYSGTVQPSKKSDLGESIRIEMQSKPGHSGAPLFNRNDKVVAVVTSGLDNSGVGSNETIAMPISAFHQLLPEEARCGNEVMPVPLQAIRDCPECPDLIFIPPGRFKMGSNPAIPAADEKSQPQHDVIIDEMFAIARTETTRGQYLACVNSGACQNSQPDLANMERSRLPVTNVNRQDALDYATWLSQQTGEIYRLPSEAEWEYAAHAGTNAPYPWGPLVGSGNASCWGCGGDLDGILTRSELPVERFPPNKFGLYDMIGNVSEFMEDCWYPNHKGAPPDATPREASGCTDYVIKGGSWMDPPMSARIFERYKYQGGTDRSQSLGFRIARSVN